MSTNCPHYDAAMSIAKTVGTNFKTLRNNKRALACGLILATAVEGFKWKDAWDGAKKASGFAKFEKDEQNQFNVMGTACRVVADNWDDLSKDEKEAIGNLTATTSSIAKRIKDAEKAEDARLKEEADKEAAGEVASQTPDPREEQPPVAPSVEDRSEMILAVAGMFDMDADAKAFTPAEIDALKLLMEAVDAFKAGVLKNAQAA